jgi:acyl carrier protein
VGLRQKRLARAREREATSFVRSRQQSAAIIQIQIRGASMPMSDAELLTLQDIVAAIKGFILEEFLPGENPAELTDSTPLITGGILDSLSTLKLVAFLEQRFKIQIQAHETMVDYLDTLADIAKLVQSKL